MDTGTKKNHIFPIFIAYETRHVSAVPRRHSHMLTFVIDSTPAPFRRGACFDVQFRALDLSTAWPSGGPPSMVVDAAFGRLRGAFLLVVPSLECALFPPWGGMWIDYT